MADHGIHCVVAIDEGPPGEDDDRLWGVVSDLDLMRGTRVRPGPRRRQPGRARRRDRGTRRHARPCRPDDGPARSRASRRGGGGPSCRRDLHARHRPRHAERQHHGEWYRPVAATYAAHPSLTAATLTHGQAGPTPALASRPTPLRSPPLEDHGRSRMTRRRGRLALAEHAVGPLHTRSARPPGAPLAGAAPAVAERRGGPLRHRVRVRGPRGRRDPRARRSSPSCRSCSWRSSSASAAASPPRCSPSRPCSWRPCSDHPEMDALAVAVRGFVFLAVGVVAGHFSDRMRATHAARGAPAPLGAPAERRRARPSASARRWCPRRSRCRGCMRPR